MAKEKKYKKIVDERYIVPDEKGGGFIKFKVWERDDEVVKYSMAYTNPLIFSGDNGRVIGYGNAHDFHHKHYFGEIYEVGDFTNYQALVNRFKNELKEFLSW